MENNVLQQLKENIAKVMIGNERTIELVLTCLVAKGHILLEDVPGTGKTVMAKSLALSMPPNAGRRPSFRCRQRNRIRLDGDQPTVARVPTSGMSRPKTLRIEMRTGADSVPSTSSRRAS